MDASSPLAAAWANWSLGNEGKLFCAGATLSSTRGVQQGDPLGPLFFACGLQPILRAIHSAFPSTFKSYYLDDGSFMGCLSELNVMLPLIEEQLAGAGLELNHGKCKLFTLGNVTGLAELQKVTRVTGGVKVLGTPTGSADFIDAELCKTFSAAHEFCHKLSTLDDPQIALSLLRLCAGT